MALIHCPECGKEISDKVKACPHCGYPLSLSDGISNDIQQVEITSVKLTPKNQKSGKRIILGISKILVLSVIGLLVNYFIGITKYNSYIEKIETTRISMINGASDAETLLNLTASVWQNSIFEESDPLTDLYTKDTNGYFYSDFNKSLGFLFNSTYTKSLISNIEKNKGEVELQMKELQEPPKGLEVCYSTITDLFTAYSGLTDFAINPSGSLQSFVADKNEKINKFLELFNKLKTQIPDKKNNLFEPFMMLFEK